MQHSQISDGEIDLTAGPFARLPALRPLSGS